MTTTVGPTVTVRSAPHRSAPHRSAPHRSAPHRSAGRRPLVAGAIAGPFFLAASFAQLPLNPGFDLARHAFSFLTLGPAGWLQQLTFVITGTLNIAAAVGLARTLAGRTGKVAGALAVLLGAGQVVAGTFRPDPAFGYPAGAPAGIPEHVSATSTGHAVGFGVAVTAWVALLVVLAVALRRSRGWAIGALLLAAGLLLVPAVSTVPFGTVFLYTVVSTGFLYTSAVYAHLASRPR
jgi:hypothetical protein